MCAIGNEPSPIALISRLVALGLNRADERVILETVAPGFVDHHPLRMPNLLRPRPRQARGRDGLLEFVTFLTSPTVDIHFTLEDAIEGTVCVAYRLYGEGTVRTLVSHGYGSPPLSGILPTQTRTARVARARHDTSTVPITSRHVADSLHVQIECIGWCRADRGMLVERWGPYEVR
jgi:hypothetical protein